MRAPPRRSSNAVTAALTRSTETKAPSRLCHSTSNTRTSTLIPTVIRKMPRPRPRNGAVITSTSPRYSVSAMTMPAINAPRTAEKPMAEVTRLATITISRQADRNSSGLLVRAAWANNGGRRNRPRNSIATAVTPPIRRVVSSGPTPVPAAWGASAPRRNTIGTSARSSNSSMASAERPTGLWVPTSGITIAVDDKASARPSPVAPDGASPMR